MTRLWPEGERVVAWGEEGAPLGFTWQGTRHRISDIYNRWRVHTRWWEPKETIWREYIKVSTETGLLCLLYQDLIGSGWFLARVYD